MTRERPSTLSRAALLTLLAGVAFLLPATACSDDPTGAGDGPGDGAGDYAHDRAPGASANDLLSDDTFTHLVVQIQYFDGAEPSAQGVANLEAFLNARLNKPGGIEMRVDATSLGAGTRSRYSAPDIRGLEAEHRTEYTRGDTLAAYLVFVDGEYSEQANVLGIAYNNTSTALFGAKIQEHTGGVGQPTQATVEGTVPNHVFGHVMGLVNNGSDMQTPHQDTGNGRHCDDDRCLMYFSVRTTDFLANILGSGPPSLDQNCIDDLRANGGK